MTKMEATPIPGNDSKEAKRFQSGTGNQTTDKTMIQTYQILPVAAIVCSVSAFAQTATDPVQLVQQNIDLVASANKILDDVKDAAAAPKAVQQINALTTQAKALDKALDKIKLTSDQAIKIAKLNGDSQDVIVKLLENCARLQQANLLGPELTKALNKFADAANIEVVESFTTFEEIEED